MLQVQQINSTYPTQRDYLFEICKNSTFNKIYINLTWKKLSLNPLILEANRHVLMFLNYSGSLFIELTWENIS
jgi:hypothetical protein